MFLLQSLAVGSVIFWFSALLSEILLGSEEDRSLPAGLRMAFASLFPFCWFAAAWRVMPIGWAWVAGAGLLALYVYGMGAQRRAETIRRVKGVFKTYAGTFAAYLAAANLFFLPLHLAGEYGPFTEGGGDVSIYADASKYATDHGLVLFGLADLTHQLSSIAQGNIWDKNQGLKKIPTTFNETQGNPPSSDYAVYRILQRRLSPSLQMSPFGQWFFLGGQTNYHVFYGNLSFLYACLLLGVWAFFRPFGFVPAAMAVFMAGASHGIASVWYNVYYIQALSISTLTLIIGALPYTRLLSWPGLKTYGLASAVILAAYSHFIPTAAPFLLVAAFGGVAMADISPSFRADSGKNILSRLVAAVFAIFIGVWVVGGILDIAVRLMPLLIGGFLHGFGAEYGLDPPVPFISWKWLNLVAGSMSQQNFPPLATQPWIIDKTLFLSPVLAIVAMTVGGTALYFMERNGGKKSGSLWFMTYAAAWVSVIGYAFVSKESLYTQAKGAQSTLVPLYVAMLIPLAARASKTGWKGSRSALMLGVIMAMFCVSLAVPRVIFAMRIANEADRSGILGPSYYESAAEITREGGYPFVWFEPRKSADLYTSIQPFASLKMVPTRHLVLDVLKKENGWNPAPVIASDFIDGVDPRDLWILKANQTGERIWPLIGRRVKHEWSARKISDDKIPSLLFAGWDYEAFYGKMQRAAGVSDEGWFTYLRNGGAVIHLPPGMEYNVDVIVLPRQADDHKKVVDEISARVAKGEFPGLVSVETDGRFTRLRYLFVKDVASRLRLLARCEAEIWLNARVNGEEMRDTPGR